MGIKHIVDYGVIAILAVMSIIAVAIAIERFSFFRKVNITEYKTLEILELELTRHLHIIATIGSNAPYVGLLGTVLGIMFTFYVMGEGAGTNVNDIMALFNNIEQVDEDTKLEMLTNWLSSYLNQQDIVDIIDASLKEKEEEEADEAKAGSGDDFEMSAGGGSSSMPPMGNLGSTDEEEPPEIPTDTTEPTTETEPESAPELAPQVDLANVEGQNLL